MAIQPTELAHTERTKLRKLFLFDCACGLVAGIIYSLGFEYIIEAFLLPRWVVLIQLISNFSYALYGAILYMSGTTRLGFFRLLVAMNVTYASLCGMCGLAFMLTLEPSPLGAWLLIVEAAFIAALALVEDRFLLRQALARS